MCGITHSGVIFDVVSSLVIGFLRTLVNWFVDEEPD